MNSGEHSSKNDRSARSRGSSRREFLGRTIRGGALLAATTVIGNELRSPENQAESQTDDLTRNPSSDASATTADLLAEKLAEWGVSVVFGLPGDKNAHIMDALRRRQDKIRFVMKKALLLWPAVTRSLLVSWASASARRVQEQCTCSMGFMTQSSNSGLRNIMVAQQMN